MCGHITRWKGNKVRDIGAGFKLNYHGVNREDEYAKEDLEVKSVFLKMKIEGVVLSVVSGYDPQMGCEMEERETFWRTENAVLKRSEEKVDKNSRRCIVKQRERWQKLNRGCMIS